LPEDVRRLGRSARPRDQLGGARGATPPCEPWRCAALSRRMRLSIVLLCALVTTGAAARAQITDAEFRQRRDSLTARLPQNAVIIAFGERDEIGFPAFYQSPNFRYLTGLSEPNAVLLITGRDASGHSIGTLFRQDRAPSDVLFNGPLEDAGGLT